MMSKLGSSKGEEITDRPLNVGFSFLQTKATAGTTRVKANTMFRRQNKERMVCQSLYQLAALNRSYSSHTIFSH